ncbi:MAG: TetR/AcrR family transcriptional regulator [bacterium]
MAAKRRPKITRAYHHGDLKDALVRSGLDLLRTEGLAALTLRGVARAAGVSQAAPYRHFADHRALVGAVAEQGFMLLQEAMLVAVRRDTGRMGFKGIAIAYVTFGLENPALYRIMFGAEITREADLPDLRRTGSGVLGFVRQGIEELQRQSLIGPGDAGVMATALWSMLHGLVALALDGQTEGSGLSVAELLAETTRIMMFGMAPRGVTPDVIA